MSASCLKNLNSPSSPYENQGLRACQTAYHNVRSSDGLRIFCARFREFRYIKNVRQAPIWAFCSQFHRMLSGTAQEFRIETTRTRSSTFDVRTIDLQVRKPDQRSGNGCRSAFLIVFISHIHLETIRFRTGILKIKSTENRLQKALGTEVIETR